MADLAPILAPLLAITLAVATMGCETFLPHDCDDSAAGNPPVTYNGGTVTDSVYLSSAWDQELLWFPGGKVYLADHHLMGLDGPVMPRWITLYDSFSMYGTTDGGAVARASPNEAVILSVSPQTIEVQNPGCQDFWLLIAAGTGATEP